MVQHLYPVQGLGARAPDLQAFFHGLGCVRPPLAQALVLSAKGFQKAQAVLGLWLLSCASQVPADLQDHVGHHPRGHDGQRPLPQDAEARGAPSNCSCTPAPMQSYWHCRGSHHTKSGYTCPLTVRSTTGQPSLHRTLEHWAADTALGRLWIGDGTCHRMTSENTALPGLALTEDACPDSQTAPLLPDPLTSPKSLGHS